MAKPISTSLIVIRLWMWLFLDSCLLHDLQFRSRNSHFDWSTKLQSRFFISAQSNIIICTVPKVSRNHSRSIDSKPSGIQVRWTSYFSVACLLGHSHLKDLQCNLHCSSDLSYFPTFFSAQSDHKTHNPVNDQDQFSRTMTQIPGLWKLLTFHSLSFRPFPSFFSPG